MEDLFASQMGGETGANALLHGSQNRSLAGSQMSDRFSLQLEEEDPFIGQGIQLAEIELKDLKQQEAKPEESTPSPVKPVNRENFKQNILSALVGSRAKPSRIKVPPSPRSPKAKRSLANCSASS